MAAPAMTAAAPTVRPAAALAGAAVVPVAVPLEVPLPAGTTVPLEVGLVLLVVLEAAKAVARREIATTEYCICEECNVCEEKCRI